MRTLEIRCKWQPIKTPSLLSLSTSLLSHASSEKEKKKREKKNSKSSNPSTLFSVKTPQKSKFQEKKASPQCSSVSVTLSGLKKKNNFPFCLFRFHSLIHSLSSFTHSFFFSGFRFVSLFGDVTTPLWSLFFVRTNNL